MPKEKPTFFHFNQKLSQPMHSSGVLVHPLAVRRSPTDDFLSCLVLFPPFVRLLFLSMSGTHGKPLANPIRKVYLCKRL